eukprot:145253_1
MIAVFLTLHLILVSINNASLYKLKLETADIHNYSGDDAKGMYYKLICLDEDDDKKSFTSDDDGQIQLSHFDIKDGAAKSKQWQITTDDYFQWCTLYIMEDSVWGDNEWGQAKDDQFWRYLYNNVASGSLEDITLDMMNEKGDKRTFKLGVTAGVEKQ